MDGPSTYSAQHTGSKENTMKTIDLEQDGDAVCIRIVRAGSVLSEHVLHAQSPGASLAYFNGGPGPATTSPITGCPGAT